MSAKVSSGKILKPKILPMQPSECDTESLKGYDCVDGECGLHTESSVRVELYDYQCFYAGLRYSKLCSAPEEDEEMNILPAHMAPKAAVL